MIQQHRSHEPLGQILIRQGLLTDEELNELLRLKTRESIYDCFLWPDAISSLRMTDCQRRCINGISLDGVPVLRVSLDESAKLELDPHEGFVLSRVNGEWNVRSILKVCPMQEDEVLIIFKPLMDITLIEFQ